MSREPRTAPGMSRIVSKCWGTGLSCDGTADSTDKAGICAEAGEPAGQCSGSGPVLAHRAVCLQGLNCAPGVSCESPPFSPAYSSDEDIAVVVLHCIPLCSSKVKHVFLVVVVAGLPQNSLEKAVSWSPGPPEPAFHTLPLPHPAPPSHCCLQRGISEHSLETMDVLTDSIQVCHEREQLMASLHRTLLSCASLTSRGTDWRLDS